MSATVETTTSASTAPATALATQERRRWFGGPWRWVVPVLLAYLVVLVVISAHEYARYNLGWDFAQADQAWYLIAHGHLNPYDSLHLHSWWKDHSEFAAWLLAPLYWLWPNDGFTLLLVQDLAVVVGIAAAVSWLLEFARRRAIGTTATTVAVATIVVLSVFNAGLYATVTYDFHFQVIGAALLVLTGRDVYAGRNRRAVVWGLLSVLSMDLSALNLAAMGLGFVIFDRRLRRPGAVMAVGGLIWFVAMGALGGSTATDLSPYTYLAGRPVSSGFHDSVAVVKGALEHPHRVVSQVWSYRHPIADDLVPSGIIGIFEPLVVLPVLAVIVPNALNAFPGYIRLGFQNSPVYLLSALGTALLLARLAARTRGRNTLVVGVAAVVVGLGLFGDAHIAQHRQELWFSVTPQAAQQLAVVRAHTPDDAEIVMGPGVMGRFAGRSAAYLVQGFPQQIPVHAHDVEFVFAPYAGNQPLPLPGITTAERWAVDTLHARVLYSGSQVQAYSWTPPRGTKTVTLP